MLSGSPTRIVVICVIAIAIGGGAYGVVSTTATNGSNGATTAASPSAAPRFAPGSGSNARSGPATGGAVGTVAGMSSASFTLSTSAGQTVTVMQASSTTYATETRPISADAIKTGKPVLVLGTTDGTTIAATQVILQTAGGSSATPSAAGVVPFQRGSSSASKQVGQIPTNYRQGSGTILKGAAANKATEAALAAYPGGIIDRVVKLSNGEYEVHNIGVNWPHHIFVNENFKVIGAD
jgi:membrane-bound inhibitor of C-type lysozyme